VLTSSVMQDLKLKNYDMQVLMIFMNLKGRPATLLINHKTEDSAVMHGSLDQHLITLLVNSTLELQVDD